MLQLDQAGLRELLDEIEKRRGAVVALGERRVELQQRALEQPGLRRHFAVGQNLERAAHDRERLRDRRATPRRRRRSAAAAGAGFRTQVLVGDELVAVALQDDARERAAADDEHLLVGTA